MPPSGRGASQHRGGGVPGEGRHSEHPAGAAVRHRRAVRALWLQGQACRTGQQGRMQAGPAAGCPAAPHRGWRHASLPPRVTQLTCLPAGRRRLCAAWSLSATRQALTGTAAAAAAAPTTACTTRTACPPCTARTASSRGWMAPPTGALWCVYGPVLAGLASVASASRRRPHARVT